MIIYTFTLQFQNLFSNSAVHQPCSGVHILFRDTLFKFTQCYCSTAPTDYTSAFSEHLTFTRGRHSDSVTITIEDDTIVEDLESFVARLSVNTVLYPGVRLAPDTANVNIRDNDGNTIKCPMVTCQKL